MYLWRCQGNRYTKYTKHVQVSCMKKTENISFRTDEETKQILICAAHSKKWSISLLVEDIVQQWIEENGLRNKVEDK